MSDKFPATIIVRDVHENPRKCSVLPLRGRPGLIFLSWLLSKRPPLDGYVRLSAEGLELSAADAERGILLMDRSWRWAGKMTRDFLDVPPRSLQGYRTEYPRVSKLGTDSSNGLTSVEALFLAHYLLGVSVERVLDHYR